MNNGYVSANFSVVSGANNIDSWLVFPRLTGGLQYGDNMYFMFCSLLYSTLSDSIRVMCSLCDSVPVRAWAELGRFKVNTAGVGERRGFRAPATSAYSSFPLRYCVINGGPSGDNCDYIGIDAISIVSPSP